MTLERPLWMQPTGGDPAITYSAMQMRSLLTWMLVQSGVARIDHLKVVQRAAGANFSVDIGSGTAVILGDDVTDQGRYVCVSTATENRTVPSPPVSGTRVHRVIARVRDKTHLGSWTTYEWTLEVLEDTGSGTPAEPDSALTLATVSVTAGQASVTNAHITDLRPMVRGLPGRYLSVSSDAGRPLAPASSEDHWRSDLLAYETWTGSAWAQSLLTVGGPAWTSYTPVLTAATTNPTLGSGSTATGKYQRIGRLVVVEAQIVFGGAGLNAGSGNYRFSLPVTARTGLPDMYLNTRMFDTSTGQGFMGQSGAISTTYAPMQVQGASDLDLVLHNTPIPWATGDHLSIFGTYEAA